MPKKQTKIDRSKLRKGPLGDAEYREIVYLPVAKGIVNPPRERSEPGQWQGNVFVADKPQESSLVGLLKSWRSMEGNDRARLLKAVASGEVTQDIFDQARREWNDRLGQFPELQIKQEAEARHGKHEKTPTEIFYENADRVERLQTYGTTDTKSDHEIRKRRLQRLRGLF